jgi:hypothetical protein
MAMHIHKAGKYVVPFQLQDPVTLFGLGPFNLIYGNAWIACRVNGSDAISLDYDVERP